jgi:hypothetical protein
MRGMRNRMIHNYFDVNIDVLWNTVTEDLPKLKQQIDRLRIDVKRDPGHELSEDGGGPDWLLRKARQNSFALP